MLVSFERKRKRPKLKLGHKRIENLRFSLVRIVSLINKENEKKT